MSKMSKSQSFVQFHQSLLNSLISQCKNQLSAAYLYKEPNNTDKASQLNTIHYDNLEQERAQILISKLETLAEDINAEDENQSLGEKTIELLVAHFPTLMPTVPRDLLWFFGGNCLHFMGEEEISYFQELEEEYFDADNTENYSELRAKASNISFITKNKIE